MTRRTVTRIVLVWLAWAVILPGYMALAQARYAPYRPDNALVWTANETNARSLRDKPYLLDPFLNFLVGWDSEFYLSIATVGYDDPDVRVAETDDGETYSLNYAFFPFYPYLMKVVRLPFTVLGLTPIAASTAAGVLISLLGTLAGMLALYDIVRDELGDEGGLRTGFMLLIFPTSVFFAVVYTEGLFVGLAFTSLALMWRHRLLPAAILAVFATWTRAVGGVLVVPLLLTWWQMYRAAEDKRTAMVWRAPLVALPVIAYGLWRWQFGTPFDIVEETWFGNGLLKVQESISAWEDILELAQTTPETSVVVAIGIGGIFLAILSAVLNLHRYPQLALFGLIALAIPLTGGTTGTQSTIRYVLTVPTLWVLLGQWSRNPVFDRAWTLLSVLLLAMLAYLFSYDFWVA